jgi:thioredoxin reductase (NADPH)
VKRDWDIVIVGGGPAGLSAAIYCGRALRQTLVVEKKVLGGQIVESDLIENYPGFADPIVPMDLMDAFVKQAERYNVVTESNEVQSITREGDLWRVGIYDDHLLAKAVIYAAGSAHRFLGVPNEHGLLGRGVSVCATCDAPFFVNRHVAVLGGGDTALTDALHLTKFAARVTIIHRRDKLRAEKYLQEKALRHGKIDFLWDTEVLRFNGSPTFASLDTLNKKTGQSETRHFDGVFMAIGTLPNTELIRAFADLDESGYVKTDMNLGTRSPGLFVAGEVIQGNRRQVAISVGMGVQAALSCEEYLAKLE